MKYLTTPVLIAFLGAILSAFGAIWSAVKQEEESKQNKFLNDQLSKKSDKIQELQERLNQNQVLQIHKTDKIAQLGIELAESQKEITRLNKETTNNVTGGDSYCYIKLAPISNGELKVLLFHEGNYPLSEIRIAVRRNSDLLKPSGISIKDLLEQRDKNAVFYKVSSLPVQPERVFALDETVPFTNGVSEVYQIEFTARNGVWEQMYYFKYDESQKLNLSFIVTKHIPPDKMVILKEER